jgi:hypothetical protein
LGRGELAAFDAPGRRLDRAKFGPVYESRSGLIALLHRLGLQYQKPAVILRKRDDAKQKAFIASDEKLVNSLAENETVLCADRRASDPCRAARRLLGAKTREARDRTDERTPMHQHGWRDRPGDRANPG